MSPLMAAGVELMLMGMGTVFFFLTFLVFATGLMSRIVGRISPVISPVVSSGTGPTDEEVAAITIAIKKFNE